MTITPELINYAVEHFPKENISESDTVLAQHLLFNDFAVLYPQYPKLVFYIVCDKIYGFAKEKDTHGNLGRKLKIVGENKYK